MSTYIFNDLIFDLDPEWLFRVVDDLEVGFP